MSCKFLDFQSVFSVETLYSKEDASRIGNTLWSSCGKYKLMATRAESICSLEKYENRDSYFKGILSFVLEIFLPTNLFISAGFLFTLDNFL